MTTNRDHPLKEAELRIARIIGDVLGFPINPSLDDLSSLHLDSLTRLEIMTLLEREFSIELTEDVASDFKSISRIARIIRQSRTIARTTPSTEPPPNIFSGRPNS